MDSAFPFAAERGFGFAEVWPIGLLFAGLALFAAIGSLYYVAVAAGAGVLTAPEIGSVTWTAIAVVVVSIVVHGVSAAPLSRRLLTAADSDRAD